MNNNEGQTSGSKAILVVGYYRTGTSALSGALTETGVILANDADANEHNPKGYFEATTLIQFDTDVLAALGAVWSDVKFLPDGWVERADIQDFRRRLEKILHEKFLDASVFGIKHPHLCRLFPLYQRVITDMGIDLTVLHTHRSPLEIATSQKKKNNLSRSHALLLWASYVIDAERNARNLPRAWVFYEDLLTDPTGTVARALGEIGVIPPNNLNRNIQFVTKSLLRSKPVEPGGLYGPITDIVRNIDSAIRHRADSLVWDDLRAAVIDITSFLEEVGQSGNRVVNGVGMPSELDVIRAGRLATGGKIISHPLRPTERADDAEKTRILDQIAALAPAPALRIIVAIPAGREEVVGRTLESVKSNWIQPREVILITDSSAVIESNWRVERCMSNGKMSARIAMLMLSGPTQSGDPDIDYAAILNAGDMIEPDAIARFSLTIRTDDMTSVGMAYCDEIVSVPENSWIRFKPDWDIHRLRESCFVGDWVWYSVPVLRSLGGFPATKFQDHTDQKPDGIDYQGAEEYAYQFMLYENGLVGKRIPEALFVRTAESRRDGVPLQAALINAVSAIDRHLDRCGIKAKARTAQLPGTFEIEFDPDQNSGNGIVIGLDCTGFNMPEIHEASGRLLKDMAPHDTLVYLDDGPASTVSARNYLDQIIKEVVPQYTSIAVLPVGRHIGETIKLLLEKAEKTGARYVGVVTPEAEPTRDDWFDVMRRRLDAVPECAAIGVRHYFQEGEIARLIGPVLFGSPSRVGNGRDAQNPGPGGWLAATQPVCALEGPGVVMRVDALQSVKIAIEKADTWVDVCDLLRRSGFKILWCPSVAMKLPAPAPTDKEIQKAAGKPYETALHHPALSVIGDPLLSEARFGLIAQAPGLSHENLISGGAESHVLYAARTLRKSGRCSASWCAEPIDPYSVNRLQNHRWVRINPDHLFDGAKDFVGLWTKPPESDHHKIVKAATQCIGTSSGIVRLLSGMGAKRLKCAPPLLSESAWRNLDFSSSPQMNSRVRTLWVDEIGATPDLMREIIAETAEHLSWIVISDTETVFPGNVTVIKKPTAEDGWAALFVAMHPHMLIRPTSGAPWRDRHLPLMAAAGGTAILQGNDLESPGSGIGIHVVDHDTKAAWMKALRKLCLDRRYDEILADAAKAHDDVMRLSPWIESYIDSASTQNYIVYSRILSMSRSRTVTMAA